MKQILHILHKDLRRFWREIAASLALTGILAWIGPRLWRAFNTSPPGHTMDAIGGLATIETLLLLLLPVSWWLLIARAVHEERLVGDRQFWITRPYEWPKLLTAKMLLVFCFILLPLAVAQWGLLLMAGLHPTQHAGALLIGLFQLVALPILPFAAMAAVTRNLARLTLTVLGILVAVAIAGAVFTTMLQSGAMHPLVASENFLGVPLFLVGSVAALLLAYSARRIVAARIVLLAIPVLFVLTSFLINTDAMIDRAYPRISNAGLQFALKDNPASFESVHPAISRKELRVQIPLEVTGIAKEDYWQSEGVRIAVEAEGRTVWQSSWEAVLSPVFQGGDVPLGFDISREVFDRVQSEPVTLHVQIALDQAHRSQFTSFKATTNDIDVPGLGVCSPVLDPEHFDNIDRRHSPQINGLNCRSALRNPQLTFVEAAWRSVPCQLPPGAPAPQLGIRSAFIGDLKTDTADLGITPIRVNPVNFPNAVTYNSTDRQMETWHICPGAPITFTTYSLVQHLQKEFTLENFRFPSYDEREDGQR